MGTTATLTTTNTTTTTATEQTPGQHGEFNFADVRIMRQCRRGDKLSTHTHTQQVCVINLKLCSFRHTRRAYSASFQFAPCTLILPDKTGLERHIGNNKKQRTCQTLCDQLTWVTLHDKDRGEVREQQQQQTLGQPHDFHARDVGMMKSPKGPKRMQWIHHTRLWWLACSAFVLTGKTRCAPSVQSIRLQVMETWFCACMPVGRLI